MKRQLNKRAMLMPLLLMTVSFCFAARHQNEKWKQPNQTVTSADTTSVTPEYSGPDVTFMDENGNAVSLKSLKGKVVFINFWATWCPPCRHEMPSINKLKQSFTGNDNIVFLMVIIDGNIKKSKAFMKKNKYDLSVYIPNSEIPGNFLGSAIPTTVILARNGDMIARIEGGRDYTSPEITKALNELVQIYQPALLTNK
ncbi:TlpA disulfide reductase family protein [Chitinophaga sancti]|uniref:TlpA family protein disulfide reductase n=1 Tax=Chitinophaga sancti TaxID=1004 RepID=UPI002A75E8B6|nr:TlpA disulfide reductase family protein [Chitinophaga sancti]WPQ63076.1 TlpA disulfide reductase family protein [Chitinophaga sancti]